MTERPPAELITRLAGAMAESAAAGARAHGWGASVAAASNVLAAVELARHMGMTDGDIARWLRKEADALELSAKIGQPQGSA